MKKFLTLFFLLSFSSSFSQVENNLYKTNFPQLQDFETYLKEEVKSLKAAGIEILINHKGENIWHKAFGYSSLENNSLLKKNSIYYIQSMTKPILSVAIMQLIEQGKLNLEDNAAIYYPSIANLKVINDLSEGIDGSTVDVNNPITIKHLLTHTSGLSHGLEENLFDQQLFKLMYNDLFDPAEYNKLEERVDILMQVPLIGQPGEQWYYSAAPDILALILQEITGQSIDKYLRENIFNPLSMNDTGYNVDFDGRRYAQKAFESTAGKAESMLEEEILKAAMKFLK